MIDVWSVLGGMIGGTVLFAVSGAGKWLNKKHSHRKEQKRWAAQQERIRAKRNVEKKA